MRPPQPLDRLRSGGPRVGGGVLPRWRRGRSRRTDRDVRRLGIAPIWSHRFGVGTERSSIHRSQEVGLPIRRDGEMDSDSTGPLSGSGSKASSRVGPVDGWLGIEMTRLGHPPDQAGQSGGEHHARRRKDGRPESEPVGEEPPGQRTGGLGPHEDHDIDGHAAGAHPSGQTAASRPAASR